ncbi:hypothetical protein GX411_01730 [Candidatus Fermentibacteria bacterium]|nr:hypothetical protein [Candidatus Fermentibacteria bacterium]
MKRSIALTASAALAVALAGCGQDPEPTDEDYITDLVAASPYTQDGSLDGQGGGGQDDVGLPEAWWRELTGLGQPTVVFENDPATGVCTLTVNRPLIAELNIDVVWDGQLTPGTKDIDVLRTRRVVVVKTGDSSDPYGGWAVSAVTPAEFVLNSDIEQEVFIQSMAFYMSDSLIWECGSPEDFYAVPGDLPVVQFGSLCRLEATVLHTNPVETPPYFVYVHGPLPAWQRHLMYDNGTMGDLVADDGIYTYEWYAEDTIDPRVIAADVIDADTFADQTEQDYDSGAWSIPYVGI